MACNLWHRKNQLSKVILRACLVPASWGVIGITLCIVVTSYLLWRLQSISAISLRGYDMTAYYDSERQAAWSQSTGFWMTRRYQRPLGVLSDSRALDIHRRRMPYGLLWYSEIAPKDLLKSDRHNLVVVSTGIPFPCFYIADVRPVSSQDAKSTDWPYDSVLQSMHSDIFMLCTNLIMWCLSFAFIGMLLNYLFMTKCWSTATSRGSGWSSSTSG
jgi:hypothetical protein